MDKAEATVALIPNVRLNLLTCDVTNYKIKEIKRCEFTNQIHVLYINILSSRIHLVVITTHYWLLQFISGHYHPLTAIQFDFQN